jgi:hypothetical protein
MVEVGYFNVGIRRREKQEARDRDEFLIANGQADGHEIGRQNGLFSSLARAQVRLVARQAEIHIA